MTDLPERPLRLHLAGITKRYPAVVANDDVSLTVRPGEVHAVLGENGAGKSTLMKVLAGIYKRDAGTIKVKVGGKEVSLCGADLGDTFNVMFNIGKETVGEFNAGEKLAVTEYSAGKMTLSSIHFKSKDTVYAITTCEGMECNPDKDAWLSVVKGKKRVKGSGFCEAGSSTGFTNLPFVMDKKGNLLTDL